MIIKPILICTLMLTAWLAIALAAMIPGSIATAAIPINTPLPPNIAIIGKTKNLLIIRSNDPTYVRKLYAAGALFVLPAREKTCLDLRT